MTRTKMHQTTVRFGPELWYALERESRKQGVSIAQFVREAALARLIYTEARRADSPYRDAFAAATGGPAPEPPPDAAPAVVAAGNMRSLTSIEAAESSALWAQARQARRRAKELRGQLAYRQGR